MSTLRTQLDQAKARHNAAKYPGDLASDVLGAPSLKLPMAKPSTASRVFWLLGSGSALAASLLIAFYLTSGLPGGAPARNSAQPNAVAGQVAGSGNQSQASFVNSSRNSTEEVTELQVQGFGQSARSFNPSVYPSIQNVDVPTGPDGKPVVKFKSGNYVPR
jgi:hypothetical protein